MLLAVAVVWLVALGPGTAAALAGDAAALAESFESVSGLPAGWKIVEFIAGASTATIESGAAAEGTHFLRIVSGKPNHTRVMAPVGVTPNTTYQFHAMVKARGVNVSTAAVLGVNGQLTATDSVRTDTQWQPLDLYVKVGPQTTIEVTLGLGHFGQLNVGTAEFDAVTVSQVPAIPDGAPVADLTATPADPAKAETGAESTITHGPSKAIWVFVGILAVVGTGVAVFLMGRGGTESTPHAG